jgi:transcriptional antiterminator RfaH
VEAWYVVYCHPREESVAFENLERQGFTIYWPRYQKSVSHARSVRTVVSSLFPRYLFVRLDISDTRWRAIRSTRGVVDLVRQASEPVPLGNAIVSEISAREDEQGYVQLARQVELKQGQAVRLQHHAFAGHDAIFQASKDSDRVVVLLSLLGREFSVETPIHSIGPSIGG